MARKQRQKAPVSQETIDSAFAHTIANGDIVDFRFLFLPYSPLRDDAPEAIETEKYRYLLPGNEDDPCFREALARVNTGEMRAFIKRQLEKKGPVQLPAELVLPLADNAVRLGKYTAAAQAYELLRIRRRMQETFFSEADAALDRGEIEKGLKGYRIATGLNYDYAAFPEPLPAVPDYQKRALMMHAEYPRRPEDCIAFQPPESHLKTALTYLLLDGEAAARLDSRDMETRLRFLALLVDAVDPSWDAFAMRYREACGRIRELGREKPGKPMAAPAEDGIEAEMEQEREKEVLAALPAILLGRELEHGEWWKYLQEIAGQHPAAALFLSRQAITRDLEIIMPRYVKDSPLITRLGLESG
jgi:hypothetical protein